MQSDLLAGLEGALKEAHNRKSWENALVPPYRRAWWWGAVLFLVMNIMNVWGNLI
jgi:hypothetical protein